MQRLLCTPAGLEQRGEVAAGAHLRDLELDRADPGVPRPGAVAVAVGDAGTGAFVGSGADLRAHLGVHHHLGEHPNAITQQIHVVFFEQLADERRDVHPGGGHRPSSSDCPVVEDGGGLLRHGDFHPRSPPRKSTTSRDADFSNSGLRCGYQSVPRSRWPSVTSWLPFESTRGHTVVFGTSSNSIERTRSGGHRPGLLRFALRYGHSVHSLIGD